MFGMLSIFIAVKYLGTLNKNTSKGMSLFRFTNDYKRSFIGVSTIRNCTGLGCIIILRHDTVLLNTTSLVGYQK